MRALITGARGTVGQALQAVLRARGVEVVAWDRAAVAVDDYAAMHQFIKGVAPDVLFHLAIGSQPTGQANESWLVNYQWPSELAWITRELGVRMVFTSSVMVFTDDAVGPFTVDTPPDAATGYGYEKRQAEARVRAQNPDAVVVRLGWQIGERSGSNNMLDFFERQMRDAGRITASDRWYPACSFLLDTATALATLAAGAPGLYQINSNTGWTFFDIASALNVAHGGRWQVIATSDFVYDQRMRDERLAVPPLSARLPQLASVPPKLG